MASMITMFLQSAYSMIDGLFVSNLIGDTALSAVNVAWPVIAVVTAIGHRRWMRRSRNDVNQTGRGKERRVEHCTGKCHSCIIGHRVLVVTILFLGFTDTLTETDGRRRRTFKAVTDLWKG